MVPRTKQRLLAADAGKSNSEFPTISAPLSPGLRPGGWSLVIITWPRVPGEPMGKSPPPRPASPLAAPGLRARPPAAGGKVSLRAIELSDPARATRTAAGRSRRYARACEAFGADTERRGAGGGDRRVQPGVGVGASRGRE